MRKIDASYRIMKIFKMLHQAPCSLDEICDRLYGEDISLSRETIAKYFKTLRKFGCIIRKRRGRFELVSVPFSLDLSDADYYYLAAFENLGVNLYGDNIKYDLRSAFTKILSLTDYSGYDKYGAYLSEASKINHISVLFRDKITKLLKFGSDNSKIKIVYDDKKMNISHVSFRYCDNAVFVHVFNEDNKSYELLLLENIKDICPTPKSSLVSDFAPYTVFELRGRLKNSYTLYEGERVIKIGEDFIWVSNNFDDKNQLFKRLIRYGKLCKIISPDCDIEKFKNMLNKMSANLSDDKYQLMPDFS